MVTLREQRSGAKIAEQGRCCMPVNVKTDEELLKRLEAAATRALTRDELRRQRVSFVYGNLPTDSTITRHQVEQELGLIEGEIATA